MTWASDVKENLEGAIERAVRQVDDILDLDLDVDLGRLVAPLLDARRLVAQTDLGSVVDIADMVKACLSSAFHVAHNLTFDIARAEDRARARNSAEIWRELRAPELLREAFRRIGARNETLGRRYDRARDMAVRLEDTLRDALSLTDRIVDMLRDIPSEWTAGGSTSGATPERSGTPVILSWSARRLAATAAWMLPKAHRARYAEEFEGELTLMADDGMGRMRQLGYSVRQLVRAPSLRTGLRAARRRGA